MTKTSYALLGLMALAVAGWILLPMNQGTINFLIVFGGYFGSFGLLIFVVCLIRDGREWRKGKWKVDK